MGTNSFTIIGAGPAGLAAAYTLAKTGCRATVLEQDVQVGGLSKTVEYKGFRFDIGGHRFFTKNQEVDSLWREILGDEFLRRPRQSRIFYRGKLFHYPLKPVNALMGLGPWTSAAVIGSFLKRKLFPRTPETNFEDWVSNRFGDSLYSIFFKTYTEKVWGIPCRTISADWAAQRIRNLDLARAVLSALGIGQGRKIASLIDEFDYPRHGPGQMYEQMAAQAVGLGAELRLRTRVVALRHHGGRIKSVTVNEPSGVRTLPVENLISSMPLSELVLALDPPPPPEVVAAARGLRYRSILTVNLLVRQAETVPDTWIYIHSPDIRAGRLQLYKNWSPAMVPDPGWSSLGLEYFAFEDDEFWSLPDEELVTIARQDLAGLDVVDPAKVDDGFVFRYAKAYPIYDEGYRQRVAAVRRFLATLTNAAPVGRYGQFRYNNMDHSILTALLGVRRLMGEDVDPWQVNEEAEYHEERVGTSVDVPPVDRPTDGHQAPVTVGGGVGSPALLAQPMGQTFLSALNTSEGRAGSSVTTEHSGVD